MRGPRRSEVNELEDASRNVYSPTEGARGVIVRVCRWEGSGSSMAVADDEADSKSVGSTLSILEGMYGGSCSPSMSVSSSTALASKLRLREVAPFCGSASGSSSLLYFPQRIVGRPVVWERVILRALPAESGVEDIGSAVFCGVFRSMKVESGACTINDAPLGELACS